MKLRVSTDCPCPLPFRINYSSFIEWNELSEQGGYEYDANQKATVIKPLPSCSLRGLVLQNPTRAQALVYGALSTRVCLDFLQ